MLDFTVFTWLEFSFDYGVLLVLANFYLTGELIVLLLLSLFASVRVASRSPPLASDLFIFIVPILFDF